MDFQRGLQLIGELGRRIPEQPDRHSLAHLLHKLLARDLPVDACTVVLPCADQPPCIFSFLGGAEYAVEAPPRAGIEDRSLTLVAALHARPLPPSRSPARPLLSVLSAPIVVAGREAGHIEIGCHAEGAYSSTDQQVLTAVADLISALGIPCSQAQAPSAPPRSEDAGAGAAIAAALGVISAAIVEEYPAEQIFTTILEQAAALIPFDQAAIQVFEHGQTHYCTTQGTTIIQLCNQLSMKRLWHDYRPVDTACGLEEPELPPLLAEAGVADLLSLPVLAGGAVGGRITFTSAVPERFAPHHHQFGLLLAERAAQVLRSTQLRVALETARAKTTQLDILRHDFVSTVSHQLRTPLTGILGYMELLLNRWTSLDDERRRSMLLRAQSSAVRLEHLVTDLLLFSNLEHQELKLQLASYPLAVLVEQAVEDMGTKYRGQVIEIRPSKSHAVVHADAQRTVQVLSNLLDNAIKYSDVGSPVEIRWITHRNAVEILVRDYGPGIKAEDLPRLFTRFGTLGHHPRPGQIGTGIGLYVSKRLLDAMNGRIWATSRLGHGSVFHITLPSSSTEPQAGG